jgi:phenylacetate-CoA ligase
MCAVIRLRRDAGRAAFRYTSLMKTIMAYLYPVEKGQKFIILNGFALGAWAGGLTFSRRAGPSGLIKNIGPDAMKIIQSMRDLGTEGIYLISGYPPFLRRLIDAGKNTQGFDWKNYCVHLFSGGEGFSEEWRDHMVSQLKDGARIFSTYGAIDLEAGIAMENPLCVAIRRLLNRDHELRHELLATNRFPCFLGMYSPLNFYISTAESPGGLKELETTVLSLRSASPKIKYNIGDEGGVIPFRRMEDSLNRRGYDLFKLGGESSLPSVVPFPFLFLLGRSDGTVSIEGSNIYASDIHDAISSDPELASKVSTFKLAVETESDASPRLYVYVEAREDVELSESWTKRCSAVVVSKILAVNECFRKSCEENPEAAAPRIVCLPFRRGVFAEEEKLIKHRYIKK